MSEWFKGDRKPTWTFGLVPASGVLDTTGLTASDFTFIFIDSSAPDVEIVGTGVLSNLVAGNPATITYAPGASDVGTVRTHRRRIVLKRGTVDQQTFDIDNQTIES
jgi:hypothetical protein